VQGRVKLVAQAEQSVAHDPLAIVTISRSAGICAGYRTKAAQVRSEQPAGLFSLGRVAPKPRRADGGAGGLAGGGGEVDVRGRPA
jgi:hypothetical protein